jgi:diguanylate cyclase (GGDEF)-like protein
MTIVPRLRAFLASALKDRRNAAWATLAIGLLVTFALWSSAREDVLIGARVRFEHRVDDLTATIKARMESYEHVLRAGGGFLSASASVDRGEWRKYVSSLRLEEMYPGIQGFGYAPAVVAKQKAEHVAKLREEGFRDYQVRPAGEREFYVPVLYREPFDVQNQRALGYDMFSEATRRDALERARDSGRAALSGKVRLVVEPDKESPAATLMFQPVYAAGYVPPTVAARRGALKGFVFAPFRMEQLLTGILGPHFVDADVMLEIFDGDSARDKAMLYASQPPATFSASNAVFFQDERPVDIAGRRWLMRFTGNPAVSAHLDMTRPNAIAMGGLAASLSLFCVLYAWATQNRRARELATQLTRDLRKSEERFRHLAHHDALTNLPNRVLLQDYLGTALARAKRNNTQVALLFVDLDRFKNINDSLGHDTGDQVLKLASRRIESSVRENDFIARMGGDEFVVVIGDLKEAEAAAHVAQHIQKNLSRPCFFGGHELLITPSIGISVYPQDGEELEALLKHADAAMYSAKANGRNNSQFYTQEINEAVTERLGLEAALHRALERGEFTLHYQPIVELWSGKIVGAEALLRWRHPDRGIVPPSEFIPIAEDTGLIVSIGEWALREACTQCRAWQARGLKLTRLAVNLSSRQLMQRRAADRILQILTDTGFEPRELELELTETSLMQNTEIAIAALKDLKHSGIEIALDDFGTGYSSLSYLRRFPIDKLKIDRSFVRDISIDPNDATLVRALIELAHSLNIRIVAEGVEIAEQLEFLRRHRCDEAQGYFFSRPIGAKEFGALLATWTKPASWPTLSPVLSAVN